MRQQFISWQCKVQVEVSEIVTNQGIFIQEVLQHAKALDLMVSHSLIIRFEFKKYNFQLNWIFGWCKLKKKKKKKKGVGEW